MDALTKKLLLAVARTVVQVLEGKEQPREDKQLPLPESPSATAKRGDTVRVWTGSMYAVGVVDSLCRTKPGSGLPRRIRVRVKRGEGRHDKLVVVEAAKAELIKKG